MNDPVIDADADFSAMFGPEDLHPDLALYLNGMGSDMRALRHPLVYDVPYFERMNKQLNLRLRLKEERLAEAVANKEWIIAIYMHERPYRAQMLHEYVNEIDDPKLYWELVSAVWTESENIWQNLDNWTDLWSFYHLKDRHEVMDEDERAALEALPDRVTVYRGVTVIPAGMACRGRWTRRRPHGSRTASNGNRTSLVCWSGKSRRTKSWRISSVTMNTRSSPITRT